MIILVTGAVRRLCIYEIKGAWAAMLVADDVTPPEPGEMTTIYARMAKEDEAWKAKAFMKAFRNSQPSVSVHRYLRVSRAGNSHHFRSSVASSVSMNVLGGGRQTANRAMHRSVEDDFETWGPPSGSSSSSCCFRLINAFPVPRLLFSIPDTPRSFLVLLPAI